MIIAAQKKKENIAEYLIYMYQVEDLIRANEFDLDRIDKTIISQFDTDYNTKRDMREWYRDLIARLKEEGKEKAGHMEFLEKHADELQQRHQQLLQQTSQPEFKTTWEAARPHVEALRMRSGHTADHDVQLALNGLYGLLILRIQGKEINPETSSAFEQISAWIALLV